MIRALQKKLFPATTRPTVCRMKGARKLGPAEKLVVQRKIKEMGPWFHNYEIAKGVWTNAQGTIARAAVPGMALGIRSKTAS